MTPEQAALLSRATENTRAARLLASQGFNGIAVSRAYFAMLYVAEALLLGEGLAYSKHSGVIAAFGQRFAKTGRLSAVYHRYLIEGEQRRNISDYDTMAAVSSDDAQTQIARAEEFLAAARSIMDGQ